MPADNPAPLKCIVYVSAFHTNHDKKNGTIPLFNRECIYLRFIKTQDVNATVS